VSGPRPHPVFSVEGLDGCQARETTASQRRIGRIRSQQSDSARFFRWIF
jgi:hypothetical protein